MYIYRSLTEFYSMEVIKPGFEYKLINFSDKNASQTIRFIKKTDGVVEDGTFNEEVINMMLNRFYHLQKISYSKENSIVIALLTEIRDLLRKRLERKLDLVEKRKRHEKTEIRA